MVAGLPIYLREALRRPAQYLDASATNQVVERIRNNHPETADGLQLLVEKFSFDQIMKLLNESDRIQH
jgi:hypothetical protein